MVFHWSLSDSKSLQVSRTRLRILAVLLFNFSVLFSVFHTPSQGLCPRHRMREGSDETYMCLFFFFGVFWLLFILFYLFFFFLSNLYFSSKEMSSSAKYNFLYFTLAGTARYLVDVLI